MQGGFAHVVEENEVCEVERDTLPKGAEIKRSFWQERQRLDFRVVLAVKNIEVEKLVVAQGRDTTIVSADIQEYGPPKMAVTWSFLAHMTLLVSQFAIPMHRLAKLVSSSTKRFSAAELSRYYRFVAEHFVPIYRHLGRLLADAPVLRGDDTPSLVLEVDRALKRQGAGHKEPLPWLGFGSRQRARQTVSQNSKSSLSARVAQDFGFESPRKDATGSKISFNTSMLSGRAVPDDPATTIIFYRSHLGSVGNLLDVILPSRHLEHHTLVIQTDLSTTNLISDKQWLKRFDVRLAGCAYHARRPFALSEQEEPMWCEFILHAFKGIPITERYLDLCGRNAENTYAVRDTDQRDCWENIKFYCEAICIKWSRSTPLGAGAGYVLRHYDKLTYYLTDPRVNPSNSFAERMLRQERLIQNNALFRATIDGRCALDIMRTVLQTAIAAEANPAAYLMWVMRMPKEAVEADPASFTPHAFSKWWAAQEAAEAAEAAANAPAAASQP